MQGIHNGFAPKDFLNFENGELHVTPSGIINQLADKNMIFANADVDIFHLRLRVYNWDYWVGVRQRHNATLYYPKAMFELPYYGNGHFIGEAIDLSDLSINASLFQEYTFGASTELNDWIFGGRISFLSGLVNVHLDPQSLKVNIDDDMYGHTLMANAVMQTSGVYSIMNDSITGFETARGIVDYLTRFRNPGMALSLGATYKFDERTTFSFAVNDLGFINWSDDVANYRLKEEIAFNGFNILGDFLTGREMDTEVIGEELTEELEKLLPDFSDPSDSISYTRWLAPSFYLSANYQLARNTHFGLQVHGVINQKFYPSISLGITQGLGRAFEVALIGSHNQRSMANVGFGFVIKPGPFQIYMIADNIYSLVVDPLTLSNLNLRFGVNLVFGRIKTEKQLPFR